MARLREPDARGCAVALFGAPLIVGIGVLIWGLCACIFFPKGWEYQTAKCRQQARAYCATSWRVTRWDEPTKDFPRGMIFLVDSSQKRDLAFDVGSGQTRRQQAFRALKVGQIIRLKVDSPDYSPEQVARQKSRYQGAWFADGEKLPALKWWEWLWPD